MIVMVYAPGADLPYIAQSDGTNAYSEAACDVKAQIRGEGVHGEHERDEVDYFCVSIDEADVLRPGITNTDSHDLTYARWKEDGKESMALLPGVAHKAKSAKDGVEYYHECLRAARKRAKVKHGIKD